MKKKNQSIKSHGVGCLRGTKQQQQHTHGQWKKKYPARSRSLYFVCVVVI